MFQWVVRGELELRISEYSARLSRSVYWWANWVNAGHSSWSILESIIAHWKCVYMNTTASGLGPTWRLSASVGSAEPFKFSKKIGIRRYWLEGPWKSDLVGWRAATDGEGCGLVRSEDWHRIGTTILQLWKSCHWSTSRIWDAVPSENLGVSFTLIKAVWRLDLTWYDEWV